MTLPVEMKNMTVLRCADRGLQKILPQGSNPIADWNDGIEIVKALRPKWQRCCTAEGGVGEFIIGKVTPCLKTSLAPFLNFHANDCHF